MTEKVNDDESEDGTVKSIIWKAILSVVVVLACYAFFYFNYGGLAQGNFAQFGDFVGGTLNPVLGFLTVGLLVWSIQIQMRELRLTREEISATKNEAEMSRKAMEAQVSHLATEAELNEINRLLIDVINRYKSKIQEIAPNQNELANIFNIPITGNNPIKLCEVIRGSYDGVFIGDENRNKLREYSQRNSTYFLTALTLIKTWQGLYRSYCLIKDSKSFKMARGIEWQMEAIYLNDLLQDDGLKKELDRVDSET